MAQNSEYTRTDDGMNVPCLTPPSLAAALPLLLPLLLEVLLAGRVRVGIRVPLHGLGLVACLLQLVPEVQRLVAVDESLSAFVFRIQCIHRCVHSAL